MKKYRIKRAFLLIMGCLLLSSCESTNQETPTEKASIEQTDAPTITTKTPIPLISENENTMEGTESATASPTPPFMSELSAEELKNMEANHDIDLAGFTCSEEIKNYSLGDGIYQYLDMILPLGITYGELQEIAKSSSIEFMDYSPKPENYMVSLPFYCFPMVTPLSLDAVILPPDLDPNSTIDLKEWIVVSYDIPDYFYEYWGSDYAWYAGGYSIGNADWLPKSDENIMVFLAERGLTDSGNVRTSHCYSGAYDDCAYVNYTYVNCKIGDYYFGRGYDIFENGSILQKGHIYATKDLGGEIYYLEELMDGSAIQSTSDNITFTNDVYILDDECEYEGSISNVTLNENGDYNITWSALRVYSPKYLPTATVATFYEGLEYTLYEGDASYKCVNGDDPDYWYFIDPAYSDYDEAYRHGGTLYRIYKKSNADQTRLFYVFLEAFDSYSPAYESTELNNVTTVMTQDATIDYLVEDYSAKEIPFSEIYNSNTVSIYADGDWTNSWRGFRDINVDSVKNGKITKISERMVMG